MTSEETSESPLRIAVVGSGPSGFFTAAEVLKKAPGSRVNMFERLPTPWGLLRAGVAPDHENMRVVGTAFDRIASGEGFRLYANVEVGTDLTHRDLLEHHHAVVYATGAITGRMPDMGGGSELANCVSSERIVGWYNGHPDYADTAPDLETDRAVVVGNGNVALDVARMLSRPVDELRTTDISDLALVRLAESQIREVVVLGRRGPAESGFTLPELLELEKMTSVGIELDLRGSSLDASDDAASTLRARLDALTRLQERDDTGTDRRIVLRFMSQPVDVLGGGAVEGVVIAATTLDTEGRAVVSDDTEVVSTGLVVWAIGFEGKPLPGVPFDTVTGTIPHADGRVTDAASGSHLAGVYTAGWVKRGPTGVIGENKRCGTETATALLDDHRAGLLDRALRAEECLDALLASRGVDALDFDNWQRINAAERARGEAESRPRVKFLSRDDLLAAARTSA